VGAVDPDGTASDKPSYKVPKPGSGGKIGSTEMPSWAKGQRPLQGESGSDFAKRLCDEKYGPGQYNTGPGHEFNQIKKCGDRHFTDPPLTAAEREAQAAAKQAAVLQQEEEAAANASKAARAAKAAAAAEQWEEIWEDLYNAMKLAGNMSNDPEE